MQIQLLGPLQAEVNGVDIVPTAAKMRQLLAVLALQPGKVVPVRVLAGELWEEPPRSVNTTLQTYVMHLRRRIGAALEASGVPQPAKSVLATRPLGYALDVDPNGVDAVVFTERCREGRTALRAGDHERASQVFGEALELWHGEPLVDVPTGSVLSLELLRLTELRQSAVEGRVDAELALGRHRDVVFELATMVAADPVDEGLTERLMIALARCGRRAQALDAFRTLRSHLIDELGVEPSARLQQVQASVLEGAPALLDAGSDAPAVVHGGAEIRRFPAARSAGAGLTGVTTLRRAG